MKTTKAERAEWRDFAENAGHPVPLDPQDLIDLLDDADRAEELEGYGLAEISTIDLVETIQMVLNTSEDKSLGYWWLEEALEGRFHMAD